MTIGIVGNYGNNNQGDEAILEGILIQLEEAHSIERKDVVVFSNQPEQTSAKYGVRSAKLYYKKKNAVMTMMTTMLKNRALISRLDLLLVGGGGIFMDLYGREAFLFGMYGWLAKLSKTPVVLYGVGAGPILTRIGKVILRSLAHLSKTVTVRDPRSKQLLQSIGVKSPVHIIGDPAFKVKKPESAEAAKTKGLQIGVTAVPFHHASYWPNEDMDKYHNYISGMAANLDKLLEARPDAAANFFSTKHPQDTNVTKEIKALMYHHDRCTIYDGGMNHQEIVGFAGQQDIIIGTRLHSLILALVTNTPIIAVSYHHKVHDFMEMIACENYTIPIGTLNTKDEFFLSAYEDIAKNWSASIERFAGISRNMKRMAFNGMTLIEPVIRNQPPKRALVLSNMYPSRHSKTYGIFVKNQVEQLRAKGLTVDVIAISDPHKGKVRLLKKYVLFFAQGCWNLLIRGRNYDVVHAHYIFPTGMLGLLYKKLLGKKLIVTSHGGDIDQMSKKSVRVQKWTKRILEKADAVIVVGERLQEEMQANFSVPSSKIAVINMGVNRQIFREQAKADVREQLGIARNEYVLLFVGNLISAKGLDDLVTAYGDVKLRLEKTSLHLIGEPKDQTYFAVLQQQIAGDESIVVHDALPQKEIAEWMAAADVFVLPSHMEGFGLVALEAMACGVPVVGTDVGGLSYLLANDTGLKAQPNNPDDLAAKLHRVLTDDMLREQLRLNGFQKAEVYDQDKLINQVIKLYGIGEV